MRQLYSSGKSLKDSYMSKGVGASNKNIKLARKLALEDILRIRLCKTRKDIYKHK